MHCGVVLYQLNNNYDWTTASFAQRGFMRTDIIYIENLLTSTDWVFNEDGARFAHAQRECVLWVSNGINRLPRVGNTLRGKAIEWANPYVQVYVWLNTTSLTYSMPLKERRSPIMLFSTIISADKLYCWIIVHVHVLHCEQPIESHSFSSRPIWIQLQSFYMHYMVFWFRWHNEFWKS